MKSLFTRNGVWVMLSALLSALGVIYMQFYLAWVALVPFFMAVRHQKFQAVFRYGFLFGLSFCAILLYWTVALISDFAGKGSYGLLFYGVALLLSGVYFGSIATAMSLPGRRSANPWLTSVLAASVWTLGEWAYSALLPGMPWFGLFRISNMVLGNLYAIQPAALGGAFLIAWCVVLVNHLAAGYVLQKQWKLLYIPAGIAVLYMVSGYVMFRQFKQRSRQGGSPVTIAILCDNTPPDVKWNEKNGSFLVQKLLSLHAAALAEKPDVELWSEAVVPWTYRPDDDFVKEVLRMAASDQVTQIMGMTSDYSASEIYNSAYSILPDGRVSGRYDKRFPVSFAEKPFVFLSLPFSGNTDRPFEREGKHGLSLPTPQGKTGVLICNDGTVPGATLEAAANGAEYLVSLSNDAWFSHIKFLVDQHFYNTRLRAVEVRKDLAINCNMGHSGLVTAAGELAVAGPSAEGTVRKVTVRTNKLLTVYVSFPLLFIYVNGLFVLTFMVLNIFYHLNQTK